MQERLVLSSESRFVVHHVARRADRINWQFRHRRGAIRIAPPRRPTRKRIGEPRPHAICRRPKWVAGADVMERCKACGRGHELVRPRALAKSELLTGGRRIAGFEHLPTPYCMNLVARGKEMHVAVQREIPRPSSTSMAGRCHRPARLPLELRRSARLRGD